MNALLQEFALVEIIESTDVEVTESKPKEPGIIEQYDALQLRLALRSLPDVN